MELETMFSSILLAYDGSLDSDEALSRTREIAVKFGAGVHLLAIIDLNENIMFSEGMSFIPDTQQERVRSILDKAERSLQSVGCVTTSEIRFGSPADEIGIVALERRSDLILLGHRDQGVLARWLNGSVGASILHHPPCSVLVAVASIPSRGCLSASLQDANS
jgi:nucleotide-binding universal stress UspA family protein